MYILRLFRGGLAAMNIGANALGGAVCIFYFLLLDELVSVRHLPHLGLLLLAMLCIMVLAGITRARFWVKDIDRFVVLKIDNQEPTPELTSRVQRKILNLPFMAASNCIIAWGIAAVVIAGYRFIEPVPQEPIGLTLIQSLKVFVGIIAAGAITTACVFLPTEIVCQNVWPYFFSRGGLVKTPGVHRLNLRARLFVHFLLISFLPLVMMAVLSYNKAERMLVQEPSQVIGSLFNLLVLLLLTTLLVAFILTQLLSHTIVDPVLELGEAMEKIEKGDLEATVTVTSNDELGFLADQFNSMTQGLKEREKLRQSLALAMEVQQNLIPSQDPVVEGWDISGLSLYCDETGGDYYDYLDSWGEDKIGLVVGDVSGHGIPSALLMATVRAFFRQRSALPGSLAQVMTDVNYQLTHDVGDSGQFMTLFCCRISSKKRCLTCVNAGHEPALVYDPHTDAFNELADKGPALGLLEDCRYDESTISLKNDQIILIGTDGIWETRDTQGELFGKERLRELIRLHHRKPAKEIIRTVIETVANHRHPLGQEDDVTLVMVKVGEY